MAEISTTYISTLPTGSAGGSKYLVQDDGNNTTKVSVNDAVASAAAITALNGRFAFQSASDLNSLTASGMYFCNNCTNAPTTSSQYWSLMVVGTNNGSSANQIASASFTDGQTYQRHYANGTWSSWGKWPSRAEITAINGKLSVSYGDVTWNTTNVTGDASRKKWYKMGRLVIVPLEFTPVSGKIANGNVICTGMPSAIGDRTFVYGGNDQQMILSYSGELSWYFPSDTTTLRRIDTTLVYFSALD